MFSTTIIPTVGRTLLDRAVHSVLDQSLFQGDFEIVVVNDSGAPLRESDWRRSERVKVIHTSRRERSVARNVGAAVARGDYLHFLDDDDWLLPGALEIFWRMAQTEPDCAWLAGGAQLVDREGIPIQPLCHELERNCFIRVMAGEWIPLQASLIEQGAFHAVGGFNPNISGPEDMDLSRRMALHYDFCSTPELVAGIGMGAAGSTTDHQKARLEARQTRELIIDHRATFRRLRSSAGNRFWQGRVIRIYLTSMAWNAARKNFLTAFSRLLYAVMGGLIYLPSVFSRDFWRALSGPYRSEAFARGAREESARRSDQATAGV